jgi:hypothetical protein
MICKQFLNIRFLLCGGTLNLPRHHLRDYKDGNQRQDFQMKPALWLQKFFSSFSYKIQRLKENRPSDCVKSLQFRSNFAPGICTNIPSNPSPSSLEKGLHTYV